MSFTMFVILRVVLRSRSAGLHKQRITQSPRVRLDNDWYRHCFPLGNVLCMGSDIVDSKRQEKIRVRVRVRTQGNRVGLI